MLDFITSKIAMVMAAVFILLVALGMYEIQKNAIEEEELENIADKIAATINEISAMEGSTKVNLTFDDLGEGIYLKPKVGDDTYEIRFTPNLIFITQNGRGTSSNLISAIHLWKPDRNGYNAAELEDLDNNREMKINSGDKVVIIVERTQIEVMGLLEHHTFVYTCQ
jgi:hypothetical protein